MNRQMIHIEGTMRENVTILNVGYDIQSEEIEWLWYPYIPYKKLTIVQGDPGEGKTTFLLALATLLTTGKPMPECEATSGAVNVIYQTAEDGLADTIKPRLEKLGADCTRVFVIDETEKGLTLLDERIEQAILKCKAKLLILDPIQAYLGGSVDMHRANEVRPALSRLAQVAERTGCAIVLIGHMNKSQGSKSAYRGLGSIDFQAAARSVLIVGRSKDDPNLRIMAQDKSSLAPAGQSVVFELNPMTGFHWGGYCNTTVNELLSGESTISKIERAKMLLCEILKDRDVSSDQVQQKAYEVGIGKSTLKLAKKELGITSVKMGDRWYTHLP